MRPPETVVVVLSNEEEPRVPRFLFRAAARWPARTAGVVITAIVHLLLSTPLLLGHAAHKNSSRPQPGPGSVEYSSRGERVESMLGGAVFEGKQDQYVAASDPTWDPPEFTGKCP